MKSPDTSVGAIPDLLKAGLDFHNQGKLADAEQIYCSILRQSPSQTDALHLLGLVYYQRGDFNKAAALIQQAIDVTPDISIYYNNLAVVEMAAHRHEKALIAAQKALDLTHKDPDTLATYGAAQQALGCLNLAERAFRQALDRRPDHIDALAGLGSVLLETNHIEAASEALSQAIGLAPKNCAALINYGKVLLKKNQVKEAIEILFRATAVHPLSISANTVLAEALLRHGQPEQALRTLESVLSFAPEDVNTLNDMGHLLRDLGRSREAKACFHKALKIAPEHIAAHVNLGLEMLSQGEFDGAWEHYGYRIKQPQAHQKYPELDIEPWTNQDLKDSRLVVWTEQGFGDEVLQASLIPDLTALTKDLSVICSDRLTSVFRYSFPGVNIVPKSAVTNDKKLKRLSADLACPLLDTARILRKNITLFPKKAGHIRADEKLTSEYRLRYKSALKGHEKPFIIALSWQSQNLLYGDQNTIPLEKWLPILRTGRNRQYGVVFVVSQYKAKTEEVAQAESAAGVQIHLDPDVDHGGDMAPVAAQLSACDLIISTSTTTAQLGAALGIPVWHLPSTGLACGWYWLNHGEQTPWYPTMRQFRRATRDAVTDQIEAVASELNHFLKKRLCEPI